MQSFLDSKILSLSHKLMVASGEGFVREFEMDRFMLLYLKWITKKDLPERQGALFNVMWQPGWEESLGENGYVYMHG